MMQFGRKLIQEQRGSTIVLVGLSLLLLLTVAGLVIDGGTMYAAKSHLQKTANAAALSGAQELTGNESDVQAIVNDILTHHGEQASLTGTDINMKSTVRVHLSKKNSARVRPAVRQERRNGGSESRRPYSADECSERSGTSRHRQQDCA
ncbi:Tad domain-containing protein [Cohnella kolymensis]|uniref:Tad domain-containing protein n=1 Tax=Cohnella kolymensis TaxID=1590652 RepID=UPI000AE1B73C|nr:Tad domain-containing protein [Cohnella kolymensis]